MTSHEHEEPDVWNAEAYGLTGRECDERLSGLHMGTNNALRGGTFLVGEPRYRPYVSHEVVRNPVGERIGGDAIDAVYSPEVSGSSRSSSLADTAAAVARAVRARLWPESGTRMSELLTQLTAPTRGKGSEMHGLLREYCARNAPDPESAVPMALRDFYASIYAWQFIRCPDARIHDLCGAALCLTIAVDYLGASDDPGVAERGAYLAAAGEGLAFLGGAGATRALKDMVVANTFMTTKDAVLEEVRAEDRSPVARPVSPGEFLAARWWDAAMAPYHRLILGTSAYRHLTDDVGTFLAVDTCHSIARAVDSIIRYNEIVDLMSDYVQRECFNELMVALAFGGGNALVGYGDSLGAVVDEVLSCTCGEDGHEEAAELAMGSCLWYLLTPRYRAAQQLHEFTADFARREPGNRLTPVAALVLKPGRPLHSESWEPLWEAGSAGDLAARVARRCSVIPDASTADAARSVLAECDRIPDADGLRGLSEAWCQVFDTALPAGVHTQAPVKALRTLVGRIWRHTVVGDGPDAGDETPERLFMDVDDAVRQSYALAPADGITVRRAFFGAVTSAVELGGLNPYARLSDGIGRVCATPATP